MKWKNSFKKGSLAAFVTLALTGSALAMPTGGTVENGSVNVDAANFGANDAIANVANGATITPQTNSIINWEAFNIAQGEALHFNTTNAALLNRVTGAQMSELLGQMTQVGGNFLYLVNPNGIHIGGTASFDVSNLTLSTLNVASEDFLKYVSGEKSNLSSQQDAAKGLKSISVDQGAHFNVANDLMLQAGKVTVADGVTFVMAAGTHKAGLNVISAETLSVKADDEGAGPEKGIMAQGNDVTFHGTVEVDANRYVDVTIAGSTVNLDRAKFRIPRGEIGVAAVQSATGETRVIAANEEAGSNTMTATAANVVQADGMEIESNGTEITGGRVELKNTTVKAPGKIGIDAYNSYESKDHEKRTEYANEWRNERTSKADKDNVVHLENTKLLNADSAFGNSSPVEISGGKIEMNNSEVASEDRISLRALNSLHEIREKPMTQRNFVLKESDAQASSDNVIQLNNTKISVNRASWDDSSWMHQYAPTYDITVLGGKVDVADDVKFSLNPDDAETELTVAAVKSYFQKEQGVSKVATEQGNDVSFHGTVESGGNYRTDMGIGGATVNLDRAKFHTPNGELSVNAVQSSEDKADGTWEDTATSANVVQADGLEIVGNRNDTEFWGGKVELKNTTIKTPGEVQVYAYKTFAVKEGSIDTEDMTAGADSVVQLTNTKILNEGSDPQAYSNVWVRGGKIEMNNSELASEDEIRLTASNSLHEVRAEGHIPKELKMEANAENTVRLSNTQLHANQASWQPSSEARYTPKNSISIYGGKVALMGVDIKAPRDVFVYALREANSEETDDGDKGEIKSDTSNVLDMRGATIEAGGVVEIWGGKTQMKASSVQAGKIDIAAANETRTAYPFREIYPTAETSNTLYLEDVKLKSQANAMDYSDYAGDADLQGGQVALKKTEIDAARASIHSGQMKQGDDGKFYLTKGTPLHMDSTKIETPSYMSRSGAVNLVNGSEIKAKGAFFVAAESYDGNTDKATVTKDTNLSLWRSKVEADDLGLMTGGLNAWKTSEVKSQKPMNEYAADLVRKDGSSFTMQRDEDSHIIEGGAEIVAPRVSVVTAPKEPSSPLFPLTPDNAQLSEQDQENIAAGRYEAQDIIAAQTGTEAQSKALAAAVGKINNIPNASSRQKAGVVTGMIQAINEMNTLTTEEKHALQVAVLDAYGAVQEAKTEGSNRTQQANDDAMRLTTMESASANMPTAEEPQDAVHFAG